MILFAAVILVLALAPVLLGLFNLTLYRTPALATGLPVISVLIPARNEEANIAAACAAVLASTGVELELVVLDDGSTDRTAAILAGIDDPRLRIASGGTLPPGWSGKQHACQMLAGLARHELMVWVDADVRLSPDALARMAGYLQHHDVGLASGFPRQVTLTWAEQLLLPLIHFLLLAYLPLALSLRRTDVGLGAGCGQLFIAQRTAYERAGGHAAIRASLHDGIMLPRAFRRAGEMTGLFDASRFASCRMYANAGQVWEGLCKNATEGMATSRALPVWTIILAGGQVVPWLFLPAWWAVLAVMATVGFRLLLAWRFRAPVLSALLHPLGVLGVLAVQWVALARAWRGRPSLWRGRAYPAQ